MSGIDPVVMMEIKEAIYSMVKQAVIDAADVIEKKDKKPEAPAKRVGF